MILRNVLSQFFIVTGKCFSKSLLVHLFNKAVILAALVSIVCMVFDDVDTCTAVLLTCILPVLGIKKLKLEFRKNHK